MVFIPFARKNKIKYLCTMTPEKFKQLIEAPAVNEDDILMKIKLNNKYLKKRNVNLPICSLIAKLPKKEKVIMR